MNIKITVLIFSITITTPSRALQLAAIEYDNLFESIRATTTSALESMNLNLDSASSRSSSSNDEASGSESTDLSRSNDRSKELIDAINDNETARIKSILSDSTASLYTPDSSGTTALYHACVYCSTYDTPEIVLSFLKRADMTSLPINCKSTNTGLTPLMVLGSNYREILELLIAKGVQTLVKNPRNETIFDILINAWKRNEKSFDEFLDLHELLMQAQDVQELKRSNPDDPALLKLLSRECWLEQRKGNPHQIVINAIRLGKSISEIHELLTPEVVVTSFCTERGQLNAFNYADKLNMPQVIDLLNLHRDKSIELKAAVQAVNLPRIAEILQTPHYLVDTPDSKGMTPFFHAFFIPHLPSRHAIIKMFLGERHDIDVNVTTPSHLTPLRALGFEGTLEIIKMLIDRGAKVLATMNGSSVLDELYTYLKQRIQIQEQLNLLDVFLNADDIVALKNEAITKPTNKKYVEIIGRNGYIAALTDPLQKLLNAIKRNEPIETIQQLLENVPDITRHCKDRPEMNAMYYALILDRFDIVDLLVRAGFPLEKKTHLQCVNEFPALDGESSLMFEVEKLTLIDLTSDPRIKAYLRLYFEFSTVAEQVPTDAELDFYIHQLAEQKLWVNAHFEGGQALLHHAGKSGSLKLAQKLLEELDAEVDLQDCQGKTPLVEAISHNHTDLAIYLIINGAAIRTALAALYPDGQELLLSLIHLNADILLSHTHADTAMIMKIIDKEIFSDSPDYLVIAACVELVDINTPLPKTDRPVIFYALEFADLELIRICLKKPEINLNRGILHHPTVLHYLFRLLATGLVTERFALTAQRIILKSKKIDLQKKDPWGATAFDRALEVAPNLAEELFSRATEIVATPLTEALAHTYAPTIYNQLLRSKIEQSICINCQKPNSKGLCSTCISLLSQQSIHSDRENNQSAASAAEDASKGVV